MKDGDKTAYAMNEGVTEEMASEVQAAQEVNNKIMVTLLETLKKGWLNNTEQIGDLLDVLSNN